MCLPADGVRARVCCVFFPPRELKWRLSVSQKKGLLLFLFFAWSEFLIYLFIYFLRGGESRREISARQSGVTGASEEDTVDMHGKTHLTAAFGPF